MGRNLSGPSPLMEPLVVDRFVTLRCRARGGKPAPEITWFLNGEKLANGVPSTSALDGDGDDDDNDDDNVRQAEIKLGPLSRRHQDARVTCQASNSQIIEPKRTWFTLDILREFPLGYFNAFHCQLVSCNFVTASDASQLLPICRA